MPDEIKPINVADELSKSFLDYSMSVIVSRALPDARDGLKPSQRRILFAMNDLGLAPNKAHRKCAKICGDTSGNYHPHGEGVIYPTLVNMAQDWTMREPLVDGQGNFGSCEGDPPAAMRYTEARLTHLGMLMLEDIEKRTVDFVPNYDETRTEPTVFPAAFPNLLVNGGTGIAVGMATTIPPHNLGEVVDAICAQVDNPEITIEELMKIVKGPDFPVSCEIRGIRGIESYLRTGRGSIRMRGRVEIEEQANGKAIITIREVPYGVNRATLQVRIAELVNQKLLLGISGMRDLSDENTRIEIELKRDARPQVVVNQLFKLTSMETSFSANMLAIHQRRPKMLSLKDALDCYIEHRRQVVIRRTRFLLEKAEDRAENLEAFLLALGHLDDFIDMIRSSKNRDEARAKLKDYTFALEAAQALGVLIRSQPSVQGERYVFSDRQVNSILELRLYQLTALERDKIKADYDGVIVEITDYIDILARESRVLAIIKDELQAVKAKYGTPRKCEILPDAGEIAIEDLIANEGVIVTLTHRGYIKRTLASEYRVQARGGKGVRGMETRTAAGRVEEEIDFVEHLFAAQAHDYLMFFTNTGRVYVERVYELPEGARSAKGRSIRNVLNLQADEKVAATLRLERRLDDEGNDVTFGEEAGFVFFATKTGRIKKTSLNDFRNYRKDGIIAIRLEDDNQLIGVRLTGGSDEIVLVTRKGMSLRFHEEQARPLGRATAGMRGIRPGAGDEVVGLALVTPDMKLLVASEKGIGKRTDFAEYRAQTRGGKGIITMKCSEKTGPVIGALAVSEADELMLMTSGSQSVRIRVSEIRETGRNAQGVKLVSLKDGETLTEMALVIADDDEKIVGLEGEDAVAIIDLEEFDRDQDDGGEEE
jgi:DNA gyrase subunit A